MPIDPAVMTKSVEAMKEWAQQFAHKADQERVTIRVGDLKMFVQLLTTVLEAVPAIEDLARQWEHEHHPTAWAKVLGEDSD